MYKKRMSEWSLGKRNREPEMRAIVRKNLNRAMQGKSTTIQVRGRQIEFAEVERYWRRKGLSVADIIASRLMSKTPEEVNCFTPQLSPISRSKMIGSGATTRVKALVPEIISGETTPLSFPIETPDPLMVLEKIFEAIYIYCAGSFETGVWHSDTSGNFCFGKTIPDSYMSIFFSLIDSACFLLDRQEFEDAGTLLNTASANIDEVLLVESPETFRDIIKLACHVQSTRVDGFEPTILRFISSMAGIRLGSQHPLSLITRYFVRCTALERKRIAQRGSVVLKDGFEKGLGPLHSTTLRSKVACERRETTNSQTQLRHLEDSLHQCQRELNPLDLRVIGLEIALIRVHLDVPNFRLAKSLFENLRASIDQKILNNSESGRYYQWYNLHILHYLAECDWKLKDPDSAIERMHEAIEPMVNSIRCPATAVKWLIILEGWLLQLGHHSEFARIRAWRKAVTPATPLL